MPPPRRPCAFPRPWPPDAPGPRPARIRPVPPVAPRRPARLVVPGCVLRVLWCEGGAPAPCRHRPRGHPQGRPCAWGRPRRRGSPRAGEARPCRAPWRLPRARRCEGLTLRRRLCSVGRGRVPRFRSAQGYGGPMGLRSWDRSVPPTAGAGAGRRRPARSVLPGRTLRVRRCEGGVLRRCVAVGRVATSRWWPRGRGGSVSWGLPAKREMIRPCRAPGRCPGVPSSARRAPAADGPPGRSAGPRGRGVRGKRRETPCPGVHWEPRKSAPSTMSPATRAPDIPAWASPPPGWAWPPASSSPGSRVVFAGWR